ncbi:hypothetical protein G1H11_09760 [Phytoactinopolyspora alkaliphila]|uniref:Uncharacterized protein n=1 Tax=Phytoactinopolyspora alkaliphila TaxID=1783498 RepID=A0A6N9YL03_9ACTN|nr:hypothetical protein [Phytoactinopolyspora alkaliphila]NED95597.1 hypothetical protein [Phytoactinopolyspora alkaliphila]
MNEKDLRGLFEDALRGEPDHMRPVHEDVARGRALRARKLRQRVGGVGVGAAALVAGALVVPASPLSLIDGDGPDPSQAATMADGAPLAPEVADDPLLRGVWDAVQAELPDDVELVEDSYVYGSRYGGTGIYLSLERDERWFTLTVSLQNARPDLDEFRPCSEPDPKISGWTYTESCDEGYDDEGRWRVIAEEAPSIGRVTVLEDPEAAAMVQLNQPDAEASDQSTDWSLTVEETDAIADAVWTVGSEQNERDLVKGIDLSGTHETWPQLHTALEDQLGMGELTPVTADDATGGEAVDEESGIVANIDSQGQSGSIAARYVTEDGVEVDLIVWQKDRLYDTFCHDRIDSCQLVPGLSVARGEGAPDGLVGPGAMGQLGDRAGMYIMVGTGDTPDPDDPGDKELEELDQKVSSAYSELSGLVPFLDI